MISFVPFFANKDNVLLFVVSKSTLKKLILTSPVPPTFSEVSFVALVVPSGLSIVAEDNTIFV